MSLSRDQRRALPDEDFAVPARRALPMIDERHCRMAWSQVMRASGLTDEERAAARERIKARAAELGFELAAAGAGLFVARYLTPDSAAEVVAWAKGQGFIDIEPADQMHVTIVHSRADVSLTPESGELLVEGDDRSIVPLGPKGAIVLRIQSEALQARWRQAITDGATTDFDPYVPHITIAYAEPANLDDVAPFAGALTFGPEVHAPLDKPEDKPMRMEAASFLLEGDGLEAMSLEMPDVPGHPNRMPFSGILTRLDQPSDRAPGGSKGKKVILTKSAAERALPSLIGMGVDFTPNFDGHDAVSKFAVITAAHIEGDAIHVGGHIYARDFPKEAARVRIDKALLGMSWELADIYVESPNADPLVITDAYFTGAAILRKDKAAYSSTSLAASAEDPDMTKEEIAAAVADAMGAALKPVTDSIATLAAAQATQGETLTALQASGEKSAAEKSAAEKAAADAAAAELARNDEIKALKTQVADLQAKAETAEPQRKTLSPQITALLAKADLAVPGGDDKLTVGSVDAALSKAGLPPVKRMEVKNELQRVGALG